MCSNVTSPTLASTGRHRGAFNECCRIPMGAIHALYAKGGPGLQPVKGASSSPREWCGL